MSNNDDPLYRIFEEHLHSGLYDEQPEEVFLADVVDFYIQVLHTKGYISLRVLEHLRNDLASDVKEMLQAKIYGHYGIAAYNKARNKKTS